MEDEADQYAPVTTDKSRKADTEVRRHNGGPDPPQVGGVKAVPETAKQRPKRNVGIVARRSTQRASIGRSAPIPTNPDPDPVKPNMEIGSARTMPKYQRDPKPEKGQPSR